MNKVRLNVTVNSAALSEQDEYLVLFDTPQVITNGTVQKDGSFYDISSLDVSGFTGKVYGDHFYGYKDVLGTIVGLRKDESAPNGGAITIDGIRFAKNHPDALLARDLVVQNLLELSIGTIGYTDDDGKRTDHRLIDLSIVGMGNNDYTTVNMRELAAQNGFDLSNYKLTEVTSMKTKVNSADEPKKDGQPDTQQGQQVTEAPANPGTDPQIKVDPNAEPVREPAVAPQPAVEPAKAPAEQQPGNADNSVSRADFDALKALLTNMSTPAKPQAGGTIETNSLQTGSPVSDKVKNMKAGERLYKQITLERSGQKQSAEYEAINAANLEDLVAHNYMDDTDASVGGLVPPYQLLDKITGCTTSYDKLLSQFGFNEMGLTYGWNQRVGDIEFTPLDYCAPSDESDFETELQTRTQERLATHTVICNKVTRFSPTNVVNMVAQRYQVAYKKALAAQFIAELQVAVTKREAGLTRTGGTNIAADPNGSQAYPGSGQEARLTALAGVFDSLLDCADNGLLLMNASTASKLIIDLGVTATGASGSDGQVSVRNYDRLANALGAPIVIVPRDLLPTLGSGSTVTIPRSANAGGNVTVNQAIFYLESQNWQGVTNGGLLFDIDSFASYEVAVTRPVGGGGSGTVSVIETRSAKQRGETVLFGEMYRGGGVLDWRYVGGIAA